MYTVATTMVRIMTGKPYLVNWMNEMGCPFLPAMLHRTTFAEAPIRVPLPPSHAPRDSAHQSGRTSI